MTKNSLTKDKIENLPVIQIGNQIINLNQYKRVSVEKDKIITEDLLGNVQDLSLTKLDTSTICIIRS